MFFFKGESVTGELSVKSCSLTFLILEELIVGLNMGQIVGVIGLLSHWTEPCKTDKLLNALTLLKAGETDVRVIQLPS